MIPFYLWRQQHRYRGRQFGVFFFLPKFKRRQKQPKKTSVKANGKVDQVGQDQVSVPHVPLQGNGQALETPDIWM